MTDTKEKAILFSAPMVQAIQEGRKTMTRRIIHPDIVSAIQGDPKRILHRSKFQVGDVLWVRETWQHTRILNINPEDENYGYVYRADNQDWESFEHWTWKPSIFMPREACRTRLRVTEVSAERLQDITTEDIKAEGVEYTSDYGPILIENWITLWESINGKGSWDQNPWVWKYCFTLIK